MKPNEAAKAIWDEIVAKVHRPPESDLLDDGWLSVGAFANRVGMGPRASLVILQRKFQSGEMDRTSGLVDVGGGRRRLATFFRPKALRPAETGASKAPGR